GARLAQTRRRGERIVRVALEEAGEARLGVLEIADLETRARLAVRVIGLGVGRRADRLGARIEARRAAGEQDQRRRRRPQSLAYSETHRHCTATLANAPLPGKRGDMANTLDAHLEAAWKLLESGDFAGARKQAEDAVALDDDSADAHTIFGAVAAAEGDVERALALLDRAMDLDPEAFDPALLAAETMAGAGQLEDALEACDVALDRAEEEDEYLDALLLRAELELGTGHPEAAQQTLGELPPAGTELPEPTHHLRVAGCLLELGELESAEQHLEAALKREPDSADALHLLGLVSEAL